MRYEPAKAILQTIQIKDGPTEEDFFLRNYNMNLYRGCSHGCVYCDARSVCYHLDSPGEVRAKENALPMLRDELRRKRVPGIVGLGGMSDGYNPCEGRERLTRGALGLLAQYGFGIGITTKSSLVARDVDLLQEIARSAPVHVTFSITTADDALSKKIEPRVARSSVRFQAMRKLAQAGILVGMWINPVLPFLTDSTENIRELLSIAHENGARYVHTHYGMTLREGNREYFYAALDKDFPGMKARYAKAYGLSYIIPSPNAAALYDVFTGDCKALGLCNTFAETNRLIRQSGGFRQESFL